jgi:hypothetical protein
MAAQSCPVQRGLPRSSTSTRHQTTVSWRGLGVDGGVAQRWALIYSEPRRPQAQRTVEKHLLKQSAAEVRTFQKLGRTVLACEADAQQAVATFAQGLQATSLHAVTSRLTRRYATPGRLGKATGPDAQGDHLAGALAS